MGRRRAVGATYRVQLSARFDFGAAAELAPYLGSLGVSHLYCSPWLQAVTGSTHGYDVVDHATVSADLGGEAAREQLGRALAAAGLGVLLDIVPNHMATDGRANAWWWDVLENGPASIWAGYFDVDWDPPESKLRNRILLPILPDHYGRVLEAGGLCLRREGGEVIVRVGEQELPTAPHSLGPLLEAVLGRLGAGDPGRRDLEMLVAGFTQLAPSWATDRTSAGEQRRAVQDLVRRLGELGGENPTVGRVLDAEIAAVDRDPDRLDVLLEAQNYRLAWWRTGADELDYRRFFDISTLVAVRQEDRQVFDDTHRLVLDWLAEGVVDGLRVDHVDGLRDPKTYLDRLVERTPGAWVVAEKILARGEQLPPDWPVAGTTGYEWCNLVGGLFVDPAGEEPLTAAYETFTGRRDAWEDVAHGARLEVVRGPLATDLRRLTQSLSVVCEGNRRYRDYVWRELHEALEAMLTCFPVYRTYVRPGHVSAADRAAVGRALAAARPRYPDVDPDLLELLRSILVLDTAGDAELRVALHFQQLSGAVMAKGVEDTAFYRYLRLTCLNEVGGDPSVFGTDVDAFHAAAATTQATHPHTLLATSTHDTKRGEDVRARLAVLSEVPGAWAAATERWAAAAEIHRAGGWADPDMEWLWYQTVVGAWPLTVERATGYMEKAAKEANLRTGWERPDPDYDEGLRRFVTGSLGDAGLMRSIGTVVDSIAGAGWINSLAQKLLTLTAPGVPDIYQGTELWDLSLVDPDNRRPVDFAARRSALAAVDGADAAATAHPKMMVVAQALALRAERPECFGPGKAGSYQPLFAEGPHAGHLVAFVRGGRVITAVPRLTVGLARGSGWGSTALTLPPGRWVNRFTGAVVEGRVPAAELFAGFPVALLAVER